MHFNQGNKQSAFQISLHLWLTMEMLNIYNFFFTMPSDLWTTATKCLFSVQFFYIMTVGILKNPVCDLH